MVYGFLLRCRVSILAFIALTAVGGIAQAKLSEQELDDFNHLTLGADVFPYDWWLRLKSSREHDLNSNWNTFIKENLPARASAIYDPKASKYISEVVGLSVTWSGHASFNQEALKSDPEYAKTKIGERPQIRYVNGKPSIRMLGTTCAACHTGTIKTDSQTYAIPGGQANLSLEWLLKDMVISIVGLFFNIDDQLTDFLVSFGYAPTEARAIAKQFKRETIKSLRPTTTLTLFAKQIKLIAKLPGHTFVKEEATIAERLKKLLKITLHFGADQELGVELEKRMDFIAMLVAGTPKKTFEDNHWKRYTEAVAGYGRVDAFNNAFNKILRNKNEKVSLSAPIGYPPIWGIQNKYQIHYTGNTNSVTNRNIGLSVAAGAIVLNDQLDSTIHFDNLKKLEKLIYKLDAPDWKELFKNESDPVFALNPERIKRGKIHFQMNCASCHNPTKIHEEYKYPLYEYPLLQQSELGTDPELAKKIVKPLRPLTDSKSYPGKTYLDTTERLLQAFFKKYEVSASLQREYSFADYRGEGWFKDVGVEIPGSSYVGRDLSGIWATAPFLHNNSVPTLWDLLQKPSHRPVLFRVKDRKFDPVKVGFAHTDENLESCKPRNKRDVLTDFQQCVDTRDIGNSNAGHDYGTELSPEEKLDLIEYLKVLKPYSPNRGPSSVAPKPNTPFLNEFENIRVGKLPLIGGWLKEKDFLRHKLLTIKKWTVKDPKQMFEELRTYRPIEFVSSMPIRKFNAPNAGLVILSKNVDVLEVLGNPSIFSVRHVGYKLDPLGGHMLGTDQTEFNEIEKPWLRKLVSESDYPKIFSLIKKYATESFKESELKQAGQEVYSLNLVDDFGRKVPALLFEKYFGFSGESLEDLYAYSYWIQYDTFRNPMNRQTIRKKAIKVELALLESIKREIERVEKELHKNGNRPINDTILERMILSQEVQSGKIGRDRIALNMIGMLGASIDTIQIALLKSLEFFVMNPKIMEEARALAKTNDLKTLQKYVMESLRLRPASPVLIRYAERDQVIAKGTPRETLIPRGTSVLLGTYSAMRDPEVIRNPEEFNINREESSYLLFGQGHHRCLGDHLAAIELSIMLAEILSKSDIKYINLDKPNATFPEHRYLEYRVDLH